MRLEWMTGLGVCAGLLALAGCNDGGGGARCVETSRTLEVDEETPYGPTAAEVLAAVEGERTGTLTWRGGSEEMEVSPAEGTTEVTVAFTHDPQDDEVRYVDSVQEGGSGTERLACASWLEIDGTLTMRTADGSLDESWGVTTITDGVDETARVSLELTEVGLEGNLSASPTDPEEWAADGLRLSLHLDASETRGDIDAWTASEPVDEEDGTTSAHGLNVPVADFTAAAPSS